MSIQKIIPVIRVFGNGKGEQKQTDTELRLLFSVERELSQVDILWESMFQPATRYVWPFLQKGDIALNMQCHGKQNGNTTNAILLWCKDIGKLPRDKTDNAVHHDQCTIPNGLEKAVHTNRSFTICRKGMRSLDHPLDWKSQSGA